ncbi:MAG: DUF3617 domain-containing protein [Caulobacterales bacterium]
MQRIAVLALVALALPSAAGSQTTYPVNPGYWEVKEKWLGLISRTERWCVEPKNITKFVAAPCNHIYHCTYPVQQMSDGKIYFEGEWRGHDELYKVKGRGSYTSTTLIINVSGSGHWHIVPVPGASASLKGAFLSADCPADAKHFG